MIAYRVPSHQFGASTVHLQSSNVAFKKLSVEAHATFNPLDMLDIFEHDRQIKVIERPSNPAITKYLTMALNQLSGGFKYVLQADQKPSSIFLKDNALPNIAGRENFLADVDLLTTMYLDLIGCPQIGVRLEVLNSAMCPKFHVDKTGIRMLCTYVGQGTQWLDDAYADRSKLGMAAARQDDSDSGLILNQRGVHQAPAFAIALLKGSLWQGNHMRGIIHRSPAILKNKTRVLLAFDAIWS
jgi:hypothetical protein